LGYLVDGRPPLWEVLNNATVPDAAKARLAERVTGRVRSRLVRRHATLSIIRMAYICG